jgi:UDP-glucose 4-epimerase
MRVLVTGGLGYIGRAVSVDLIGAGHEVVALGSAGTAVEPAVPALPGGVEVVTADIRDADCVARIVRSGSFDAVVHLAALARAREPGDFHGVNVGGTRNLLRAVDSTARRPVVVCASTAHVYGARHAGAVSEDDAPSPESPYAESKLAAERLVADYAFGAILRIFNVGGAVGGVTDTDISRIVPALLSVAAGERPSFGMAGDGTATRDFVHVADVAAATRAALSHAVPGTCSLYNIGSGIGTRVVDVVRCVEDVTGRRIPVERTPDAGSADRLVADVSRARQHLGWTPARSDLRTIVADSWASWPGRSA